MVALRKESVDRNPQCACAVYAVAQSLSARRAWIEIIDEFEPSTTRRSLSARRAWIEIRCPRSLACTRWVALRKESVDRNYSYLFGGAQNGWSLSARRAWIEISTAKYR